MLQLDVLALAKIENTIQKLKVYGSSIKNTQQIFHALLIARV
jgi:hypothetical protein